MKALKGTLKLAKGSSRKWLKEHHGTARHNKVKKVGALLMTPVMHKCFEAWVRYTHKEQFTREEKEKINKMLADANKRAADKAAAVAADESMKGPEEKSKPKKHKQTMGGMTKMKLDDGEAAKIQAMMAEQTRKKKEEQAARHHQKHEAFIQREKEQGHLTTAHRPPPEWPTLDRLVDAGLIHRKKFNIFDLFKLTRAPNPEVEATQKDQAELTGATGAAAEPPRDEQASEVDRSDGAVQHTGFSELSQSVAQTALTMRPEDNIIATRIEALVSQFKKNPGMEQYVSKTKKDDPTFAFMHGGEGSVYYDFLLVGNGRPPVDEDEKDAQFKDGVQGMLQAASDAVGDLSRRVSTSLRLM